MEKFSYSTTLVLYSQSATGDFTRDKFTGLDFSGHKSDRFGLNEPVSLGPGLLKHMTPYSALQKNHLNAQISKRVEVFLGLGLGCAIGL